MTTPFSNRIKEEPHRYAFDLDADSLVLDCGFYNGLFTEVIRGAYQSKVIAFEPCREFYDAGVTKFKDDPKVELMPFAVGAGDRQMHLYLRNDSTGFFSPSDKGETAYVRSLLGFLRQRKIDRVDLLKLNVEGMEYEILEQILAQGALKIFRRISVQFHHNTLDYVERHKHIKKGLLAEMQLTYDQPFVWENFEYKDESC